MAAKAETRYEIREALGQGGMGVVYRAYDTLMKREVAVKTLLDVENREGLDLFYKEWAVLASIVHPNIVEIYDIGEMEREGKPRPYFVMPLLPGKTLDDLIQESSHRLTVERAIEIICQACRGLQVAHERGLVHRDIKPSNLFVMVDDSVKIIDFGIAHLVDVHSATGLKGTLPYMAPEQILMKPPSAASDIFSLGVVAYEALTRRRPFTGANETELARAIVQNIPPPASEINPMVSPAISQVVHKAMAKQPWHRFAGAREFGEALQQALHNQPIACFDQAHVQPRIERAASAFQQGESRFASEVLSELEAEGYIDPQITTLRRQIDHAVRHATVRQLLDSATRCLRDHEYPLALRKIQEALELDPNDTDALSLKGRVEKERREKKADEWTKLARQHLENCAFSHARLALQNLLELKPTDTQGLQLAAEVDRREQEYVRTQQEISQLHQAALAEWQKGQVSSALVKLERLLDMESHAPNIDPRQTGSFRTLYDEVRSEHDNIKNAFETAKTQLASDNLTEAMELCDQYLAKYPGHALFQALKYDAEERQRQKLSAFIAETDRKVEKEPDLDRRHSILEEALRTYPGETHFERALRLVRDKRELVNSIVGRAQFHEERGQFNEAVDQLKILQTVHSQYPGLEFEIERLMKRRDQQARVEAKSGWVKQVDRHLESSDYGRAIDAAKNALTEFPDDVELKEMLNLATEGAKRTAEALALLDQGRELCAQNRFDEGVEVLRKARALDERNSAVRAVLVDSLLQQARSVLDADWRSAEELVQQILDLDHDHVAAKSMRTLVADRKQDEIVSQCTAQARRLQAAGELENSLAVVEQGLKSYPNDPRLQQLQATLIRTLQDAKRNQARRRDLDEMRRLEQHLEERPELTVAQRDILLRRVVTVANQYPDDHEIQPLTHSLQSALADNSTTLVLTPAPEQHAVVAPPVEVPGAAPAPPAPAPRYEAPPAPAMAAAKVPGKGLGPVWAKLQSRIGPLAGNRAALLGVIGVLVLALAGITSALVLRARRRVPPPVVAVTVPVEVTTAPPGAVIQIDGEARGSSNLTLNLSPGVHQLKATMEGYRPGFFEFSAKAGASVPVNLTLQPLPPVLRLLTDLDTAKILLDDQPAGELQNGEFTLDEVPTGKHTVKLASTFGEAVVTFESAPADIPGVTGPIQAKELMAMVASSFRGAVRLQCKCDTAKVFLDGKPPANIGPAGLEWTGVGAGLHELAVEDTRKVLETGSAPALNVFLKTDRNTGVLVISTGEDDATVYLNNKAYARQTQKGRLRISNLSVQAYTVRVSKPGFEAPAEQRVQISKGGESRLDFQLRPVIQTATLQLEGALAGAEVLVDGKTVGEVQADGNFSLKAPTGEHTVELRKNGYLAKHVQKDFQPGQVVHLTGAEINPQPATGVLHVTLATPGAVVSLRREGEQQARVIAEGNHNLPEGKYLVTATAPKFADYSTGVTITAGSVQPVEVRMRPLQAERQRPAAVQGWPITAGWTAEGGWLMRQGGNFLPLPVTPTAGKFNFTVLLRKGRRVRWFLNRIDDRNYDLIELDKKTFYRSRVTNGKTTEVAKVPHNAGENGPYQIQVEVSADTVTHSIRRGGSWAVLDTWHETGRDLSRGTFGFLITGRDEMGLADFSFQPR